MGSISYNEFLDLTVQDTTLLLQRSTAFFKSIKKKKGK